MIITGITYTTLEDAETALTRAGYKARKAPSVFEWPYVDSHVEARIFENSFGGYCIRERRARE